MLYLVHTLYIKFRIKHVALTLKGQSQGHNAIFKGQKMTFKTKILEKKLYYVNQHQKYYKLFLKSFL